MRALLLCLLLMSCVRTKVSGYQSRGSLIKICGGLFTSIDDIEDEAENTCKSNYEILECRREVSGYIDGDPIRVLCCAVSCPNYKNRRRND